MHDWLDEGGKVLATHFQYYWFKDSPVTDFQTVATWTGTSYRRRLGETTPSTTGSPGGMVFDQWLSSSAVGAATGTTIALDRSGGQRLRPRLRARSRCWYTMGMAAPRRRPHQPPEEMFSFATPIGGTGLSADSGTGVAYCGRVLFAPTCTRAAPLRHPFPGHARRRSRPSRRRSRVPLLRPLGVRLGYLASPVAADLVK